MFDMFLTPDAIMQYFLFAAIVVIPFYQTFKRAGFNPIFAMFIFVPYTGFLICLGFLGFKKWPNEPELPKKAKKKAKKKGKK